MHNPLVIVIAIPVAIVILAYRIVCTLSLLISLPFRIKK